jgi:hypothetical protein
MWVILPEIALAPANPGRNIVNTASESLKIFHTAQNNL